LTQPKVIFLHALARRILQGPNYQGRIECLRDVGEGEAKHDEIVLTVPFRFSPDDLDFIETIFEELSTGLYLPRSSATKGLIKKGESDGNVKA